MKELQKLRLELGNQEQRLEKYITNMKEQLTIIDQITKEHRKIIAELDTKILKIKSSIKTGSLVAEP